MARTKNPGNSRDSVSSSSLSNPEKRSAPVIQDTSGYSSKRARNEENAYASGALSAPTEKFAFREILERTVVWINLESFKREGYDLEKWLGPYRKLLTIKNSYNIEVLRSFYSNLSIRRKYDKERNFRDILLSSSVRGKEIHFGFRKINQLLGLEGEEYNIWMSSEKLPEDELVKAYGTSSPKPADMPGYHRLVHYAYTRLMTHKNINFGAFTLLDNPWLARLLLRQPINLGQLMIMEITRFIDEDSSKSPLPFPQFISFLLENFKIKSVQELGNKDCKEVNVSLIRRMNISFEESFASSEGRAQFEHPASSASSPAQAPPASPPASSRKPQSPIAEIPQSTVEEIITKISTEIAGGLQRLNDNLMNRMNLLEERNQRLSSKLNNIMRLLGFSSSDQSQQGNSSPSSSSSCSSLKTTSLSPKQSTPSHSPPKSPILSYPDQSPQIPSKIIDSSSKLNTTIDNIHSPERHHSLLAPNSSSQPSLPENTCRALIPYLFDDNKRGRITDQNQEKDEQKIRKEGFMKQKEQKAAISSTSSSDSSNRPSEVQMVIYERMEPVSIQKPLASHSGSFPSPADDLPSSHPYVPRVRRTKATARKSTPRIPVAIKNTEVKSEPESVQASASEKPELKHVWSNVPVIPEPPVIKIEIEDMTPEEMERYGGTNILTQDDAFELDAMRTKKRMDQEEEGESKRKKDLAPDPSHHPWTFKVKKIHLPPGVPLGGLASMIEPERLLQNMVPEKEALEIALKRSLQEEKKRKEKDEREIQEALKKIEDLKMKEMWEKALEGYSDEQRERKRRRQ